jgi:quercetin dioxygenase-like cupin family protein
MRRTAWLGSTIAAAILGLPGGVHADGVAKPQLVLKETVAAMPSAPSQEVRVFTAMFKPGDRTVSHTHRFPVTVYVLEGAFTLELEGREPIVVRAGHALVEPPLVKMTGYNRSATESTRVVVFYVSDVATPFLDLKEAHR